MAKPWFTSKDLIASVKRKIAIPVAQNTFSESDILAFANEETAISLVPSVMEFHEEYFVHKISIPLVANQSRYAIPDRAIGMKMRDLFFEDTAGNLQEMTRISPDDQAYWQSGMGGTVNVHKFYMEGNDVVVSPNNTTASGSLVFTIYLRPNQLVDNVRACICRSFTKTVTVSNVQPGDVLLIGTMILTADQDFAIGASDTDTATNLVTAIQASGQANATNGSPGTNVVLIRYNSLSKVVSSTASSLVVQITQGVEFDQVPSTYLNPDTNETEDLFVDNVEVDFLQTKPGHRTYSYDVMIPTGGISGNIINFSADTVPPNFLVGDYVCLANECIIPQVPPDLHNGLAERTGARILASLGDTAGLQNSMAKIQEIEMRQGNLLDSRVEGAPQKISGRKGLLRYGKRNTSWRA